MLGRKSVFDCLGQPQSVVFGFFRGVRKGLIDTNDEFTQVKGVSCS